MKVYLILLLATCALGEVLVEDGCEVGETYWCSSVRRAKQCGAFNHCLDAVWPHKVLEKDTEDVCQFCESIIKDVRAFIDSNKENVQQFMDQACSVIPIQELADQCKQTVDQDLPEIFQLIDSELDPQTVCSVLGLCSGFSDMYKAPEQPKKSTKDIPICADCKKFMGDIKAMITDETTEKEIEDMIEQQLCAQLGGFADTCKSLVEQYAPLIFDMLSSEVDPDMICQALGFCTQSPLGKTLFARMRLHQSPLYKAASKLSGSGECEFCKTIMGEMQSMYRNKATQEEIITAIKQNLCASLGSLKDECDQTVDQYAPELFQILVNELDPSMMCTSLGFCSKSQKLTLDLNAVLRATSVVRPVIMTQKKVKSGTTCALCKVVVNQVDQMVENNATEAEIKAAIEKVCTILPDTLKEECTDFVNMYGDYVISLLEKQLDPELVCEELKLCTPPKTVKGDTECALCKVVVSQVDKMLADNATDAEIKAALEKVCSFFPDTIKSQCDDFINTYGDMVISLLAGELSPEKVCEAIKLCTPAKKVKSDENCVICEFMVKEISGLLENNSTEAEIEAALDKVCSLLPSNIAAECTNIVDTYLPTLVIILQDELNPEAVCSLLGLCTSNLNKVRNMKHTIKQGDAELCGVCETVIQYMDSILELNSTDAEIEQALDKVCNFVPKTIQQECTDLVAQYAPELIQMIAQFVDPKEICQKIGLCPNNVHEEVIVPHKAPLLGDNECTYGPSYWCASKQNALKCKAVKHCENHVWNQPKVLA